MVANSADLALTPTQLRRYCSARLPKIKQTKAREWRGPCMLHGGTRDSFSMNSATGRWTCFSECGIGGSIYDLEMRLSGCDFKSAVAEVRRIIGEPAGPIRPFTQSSSNALPNGRTSSRIVATYDYTDEAGELLYQVVRFEPKDFRPRYLDDRGVWVWKKHPGQVLYNLPKVMKAPIVFVVEGEKDADTLGDYGFIATTNAGGAKAPWLDDYTDALREREVILIPDNDPPGWARAKLIAGKLFAVTKSLIVFDLPSGIKDITEWFELGHSEVELVTTLETVHGTQD